jgi:hemerythrin-like domain-containing protein
MSPPERQGRSASRRAVMFGGGGLIVGAAAGAGIGLAAAPTSAAVSPAQLDAVAKITPTTEELMEEHGLLKRIILTYREMLNLFAFGAPVPRAAVQDATQVIQDFIHDFHEPAEEAYVFPVVRSQMNEIIDTLLVQHARGREQTQAILTAASGTGTLIRGTNRQAAATAMNAFANMYEAHECWEDTVVFPGLRAASTPTQIVQLANHFQALQTQQFGPNAFGELLSKVESVEQSLGISDIAHYTPPQAT